MEHFDNVAADVPKRPIGVPVGLAGADVLRRPKPRSPIQPKGGTPSGAEEGVSRRTRKLDPALKSWLDNVIIPALVREYLSEIEKQNRLATVGGSEVTSE